MIVPDEVIKWVASISIPAGGGLFLFLLKRTFADFEGKLSKLFSQMEKSLLAQQDHDTRIQLLAQRISFIERRNEVERAARPSAED